MSPGATIDSVSFTDFNGDCLVDLAAGDADESAFVFLADGSGGFGVPQQISFEPSLIGERKWISCGDVDKDGAADFVTMAKLNNVRGFATLFGDGNGGFSPPAHLQTFLNGLQGRTLLRDLNGDGATHLLIWGGGGWKSVFSNNGAGQFLPAVSNVTQLNASEQRRSRPRSHGSRGPRSRRVTGRRRL